MQGESRPAGLERCPFYRDSRALLEIGIATIVRVSQCDDPAIALKAGRWLVEYGERLRKGEVMAQGERKDAQDAQDAQDFKVENLSTLPKNALAEEEIRRRLEHLKHVERLGRQGSKMLTRLPVNS
jgi:hypothetical protein